MLEIHDIHTYYGTSYVLQGVSLRVEAGQVAAVLGRNGVGKTTLVRSLMGTTPPRSGDVVFKGRSIAGWPPYRIAKLGIALVPQGRRVFPSLSVREHLELGWRKAPPDAPEAWDLDRVFDFFPVLRERQRQRGTTLSGGEQQMLACARALISNPELLLMDEPSEGLAPQRVRELGEVLGRMKRTGLSILLVEQKLPFALRHADHVYILGKGSIVYQGSPDSLAADPDAQQRFLGVAPS